MIRRTIRRAVIGFIIGMAVGDLIAVTKAYFMHSPTLFTQDMIERFGSESMAMLMQTLLSGIHGAIAMAGVSFYEIEEWGLLKASLSHYLLIIASFTAIGLILGWLPLSFKTIIFVYLIMGVAYFSIWLFIYFQYKEEVKELNEILKKEQKESDKE